MIGQRRSLQAKFVLKFQIVVLFLTSESLQTPMTNTKSSIHPLVIGDDAPPVFPAPSNNTQFAGRPILDLKNFSNTTSHEEVINVINRLRQETQTINKTDVPPQNLPKEEQTNKRETDTVPLNIIQKNVIYYHQHVSENRSTLFLVTIIFMIVCSGILVILAISRKSFKNRSVDKELLITNYDYNELKNVISNK